MSDKVKIDKIKPEGSEGDVLKHCYFQQDDVGINMYKPTGGPPINDAPIIFNLPFNVQLEPDGPVFTVNCTGMSGTWQDQHHVAQDPGDGTFQAQAGGTGEPEDESASSAYA